VAETTTTSTTVPETTPPETTVPATTPATDPSEPSPSAGEPDATTTTIAEPSAANDELTADRPYDVFVPTGYDAATPTPLVFLLHGYTASGDIQEAYFQFEPLAESRGFLYVHPDGTVDPGGQQFWNATDACCAFGPDAPDDTAYLMAIIEQVSAEYNVDPKAIFLAGHSNGGFMSYRMACQHADTIAGIASLAGATFADTADCTPSEPVSVLQVHGTSDETIAYDGGSIAGVDYPSAAQTVEFWVANNGCDPTPTLTADALDLDGGIDGAESDAAAFGGCEQGSEVEFWTIDGGSHTPGITADFSAGVIDFLLAHPKP
jgi:polyhydroxybutyrate depolymerase